MAKAQQPSGDHAWALISAQHEALKQCEEKGSGRQTDGVSGMRSLINPAGVVRYHLVVWRKNHLNASHVA